MVKTFLLIGYCNVDESDITGESSSVIKSPLPIDSYCFSYQNTEHILYQGSIINQIHTIRSLGKIRALAIATGINTYRGNLIQNIMFNKETNFKLSSDITLIMLGLIFVFLLTIVIELIIFIKFNNDFSYKDCEGIGSVVPSEWSFDDYILTVLDSFTVIFPPILPISLTFCSFYFHFDLKRKRIICVSEKKLNTAGMIDTLVIDKTGTLTNEEIQLYGFQIGKKDYLEDRKPLKFDDIQTGPRLFNLIHSQFWKKFCANKCDKFFNDYSNNDDYNLIYFIECLASCHSIDLIKGNKLGNSIDKKIFEILEWTLEKNNVTNISQRIQIIMKFFLRNL